MLGNLYAQSTTPSTTVHLRTTPSGSPKVLIQYDAKGRELAPCGCLKRAPAPPPPDTPPCPITPENIPIIEKWFLEAYAASGFNTCSHQPLPLMAGLLLIRIHVKPNATPVAIHRPSTIPAHWEDQVRVELEQDIELGVLERVPSNTPTTWCSCMHVIGKKSGNPRRVIDLRAVNAATSRQTHATEAPFKQAMSIPPNTWRYTSDTWNGYHSIPLDARDRHLTTFLTPWGHMRYRVAPKGSISSGDGYTYWYDHIIRSIERIKKYVDDVLGWAATLIQLFFNATFFLFHTNSFGIIQNPEKFFWGRQQLE